MNDKELVEVWRADYLKLMSEYEKENPHINDRGFIGYMLAKRSQPSVVLPKDYGNGKIEAKIVNERLTAAGIKYTIGE